MHDVRSELGPPQNTLARGSSEVWLYEDGTRLKFENGSLDSCTGCDLTATSAPIEVDAAPEPAPSPEPEQILLEEDDTEWLEDGEYPYDEEFGEDWDDWEEEEPTASDRAIGHAIHFVIGLVVVSIVLWIGFKKVSIGFVAPQIFAISGIFNLFTLVLGLIPWQRENRDFFYVDTFLTFTVLVSLIYLLSEVRTALTAIKIAIAAVIIARVMAFVAIWLAVMLGASLLF
jgi:hypothetical protein